MPDRDPATPIDPKMLATIARPIERGHTPTVCGVPDCPHQHRTTNLCIGHYMQLYKWRKKHDMPRIRHTHEDALTIASTYDGQPTDTCLVTGCDRRHVARGLCKLHYSRAARANGARW